MSPSGIAALTYFFLDPITNIHSKEDYTTAADHNMESIR